MMMRTLVDLGKAELDALNRLAEQQNVSRAALIRTAVSDYLGRHANEKRNDAFGLWQQNGVDGLTFQEEIRGEW
jgi:metal-responsive CopG/Arc/MetJ family transcriptional regulator